MKNIIVIGGGAAGMMCAALAAEKENKVTLIEKNEKLGKKLFITGKGRCNFTNACSEGEFIANVLSNGRFLYSAIYGFPPAEVMQTFEKWGMPYKIERGRRAFPASDKSADVIDALKRQLRKRHVAVMLHTEAMEILLEDETVPARAGEDAAREDARKSLQAGVGETAPYAGKRQRAGRAKTPAAPLRRAIGVRVRDARGEVKNLYADSVVIATGGLSYPSTGSTGDGYRFAAKAGMKVTETYPSLVPMNCAEPYVMEMQGLSLKNVELHFRSGKKDLFDSFGEMMFTHFGVTGPLVLSASAKIGPLLGKKKMETWIDLKPAVPEEELDVRLRRIFEENPNREFKSILHELFPSKMIPVIPEVAGIDPEKRIHDVTREERHRLLLAAKHFPLTVVSLRGYNEAVITKGGVAVKEIDPGTMEAKKAEGLYVIGEALDLDAYTGGYNLQIAWCTAAACAAALSLRHLT